MKTLVCLVEGRSEEALLEVLLEKMTGGSEAAAWRIRSFNGKHDLEKNLLPVLRTWRQPDVVFLILRDQDAEDCRRLKEKLASLCRKSGRSGWLVRIACRELESFFLGDLAAVERGLGLNGLRTQQNKKKFREPDMLDHPGRELERLIGRPYNKLADARAIAPHLDLERNTSRSFNALISGIRKLVEAH